MVTPRLCIVDGVSTGVRLARELHARGIACAHVASTPTYRHAATSPENHHLYTAQFALDRADDFQQLAAAVRAWSPTFVIAGSESGVALADSLCAALGITEANDATTTAWRRNKYAMHDRLRRTGLAHARQIRTADIGQAAQWLCDHNNYPVVVKPLDSAGSDGVQVCDNFDHALAAFASLRGVPHALGGLNEEVLIQEYLAGTLYAVNTISWNGEHYVSDIWKDKRRPRPGGAFLFEGKVLQPSDGEIEQALSVYTCRVLDALGLRYGAGHSEVMWTSRGAVLVEVNARLNGACIEDATIVQALGYTQAQLLADAYVRPKNFHERRQAGPYAAYKNLGEVAFLFSRDGQLTAFPGRERIAALPSFCSFSAVPALGSHVKQTIDTCGAPGFASFLHPDRAVVEADVDAVITWQRADELFTIAEENPA
ncbi:MAG: ATP-grasp domain-containing protein [Mycobacteriaceae bacterium]|nr:ATP-grasp domain-containing protein [Mycobacteriaceae bacterium]